MREETYRAEDLVKLFRRQSIAGMAELKMVLGTEVNVTVFRKLKTLGYHTSYSHGGRYYTVDEVAEFDERGLWNCGGVFFSRYGTLLSTAEALVKESIAGYTARELVSVVGVEVKGAMLQLVREDRLVREKGDGVYVYYSPDAEVREEQMLSRRLERAGEEAGLRRIGQEAVSEELKAAIVLFISLLDEKQRRLFAGLESAKWGHGGDRKISELLGLDIGTVARGRRELLTRDVELGRVRKAGGGRKRVEKKRRR